MSSVREELAAAVVGLGAGIKSVLDPEFEEKVGFILLIFDFGDGGFAAHSSNAAREDQIAFLREYLERLESHTESTKGNA